MNIRQNFATRQISLTETRATRIWEKPTTKATNLHKAPGMSKHNDEEKPAGTYERNIQTRQAVHKKTTESSRTHF